VIVTASDDGTARIWDAQTGQELHRLEGHTGRVWSAAFSPATPGGTGSRFIVTASDDGTIRTWDAQTGQPHRVLKGHTDAVLSAVYSPATSEDSGGRYILSASADGTVRIWIASIDDLLVTAESLIQREPPILTLEERQRFLGE
jgi:WD40 repeat protein